MGTPDLKRAVDRWMTPRMEKSLRKFDRLTDESYRPQAEGKYVGAWIARGPASLAL